MAAFEAGYAGISTRYITSGTYVPAHTHTEIELIYILNGEAEILLEGERHALHSGDFIAVDSGRIHELRCTRVYMFIDIKMDETLFESYLDGERDFMLLCSRAELTEATEPAYAELTALLRTLPPLYVSQEEGNRLESDALILRAMRILVRDFSVKLSRTDAPSVPAGRRRMSEIMAYIEAHYNRPIPLGEIAGHFGLSREYFSRMFRRCVGVTFTRHVNHVRLTHIYHDLCTTDEPVCVLTERHGFTNYRLFMALFRGLYGCTPRTLRQLQRRLDRRTDRKEETDD
ncbi:helix-turn-helix transcriptional regulator [Lachnoclostridium sp. Marseille-P6806]|uniref:helix-turn-helix transcriptional regulator n=1 Tax=Lachnoclostridium sp. Marseille-P6806 TaxID=2364793 RepID=UPI001031B366|nr:AraC family transcriptional regulator [Lachnoclostridium sp. Marseille-P6806]